MRFSYVIAFFFFVNSGSIVNLSERQCPFRGR